MTQFNVSAGALGWFLYLSFQAGLEAQKKGCYGYIRPLLIEKTSAFCNWYPQFSDPWTGISEYSKTTELIIDFRKKGGEYAPIYINGTEVKRVESSKFLGVTITDLSWTSHVDVMVKK
eukprot:g28163.t1